MRVRRTSSLDTRLIVLLVAAAPALACAAERPDWFKGNLHTHTLWSDGDQFPEVVLDWYKTRGYAFVALSDHNVVADGERWVSLAESSRAARAVADYRATVDAEWIASRTDTAGREEVRLKRFDEFAPLFDEAGRFLVIRGEEITEQFDRRPIHLNATNIAELIPPQGGGSVVEVMQNNIDAVFAQRRATGQPMFPHVNHPNFGWALTAEDLMAVRGENFFEVYNGHPAVHNEGDSLRASTERIWDIILTDRVSRGEPLIYGIAVDDAHAYTAFDSTVANPGRGWVMVRASELSAAAIVNAMEAGAFYGSSGVQLDDVTVTDTSLTIAIRGEPGVTYTTQFLGTRAGYDASTVPLPDIDGLPLTRRYSADIGESLLEVSGTTAVYRFTGDELYVRARVRSSKPKANPVKDWEVEMAWVQPVVVR